MNIDFEKFKKLAKTHNVIPVFDTYPADLDTPVSALLKIKTNEYDFLFESVVGGENWARYSFLGTNPLKVYQIKNGQFHITQVETNQTTKVTFTDPLDVLREEFSHFKVYEEPQLPRFFGGVVGYFGYDMVKYFDKIKLQNPEKQSLPESYLILTDTVIVFDNLKQVMNIVNTIHVPDQAYDDQLKELFEVAQTKLKAIKEKLGQSTPQVSQIKASQFELTESMTQEGYCDVVNRTKEYIEAGDIFQGVLSMRFDMKVDQIDPVQLYRSIRRINPSPYMYYLRYHDLSVVGASPELLASFRRGQS